MKKILLWIWQLPQHILGFLLLLGFKLTKSIEETTMHKNVKIYWVRHKSFPGISLGEFIIINKMLKERNPEDPYYDPHVAAHEYGHTLQSRMLGPLYLLIVGLPSITQNIISSILLKLGKPKFAKNYYNRFPENWADKLGNVNR